MPWHIVNANAKSRLIAAFLPVVILGAVVCWTPTVNAVDNDVGAVVCGVGAPGATIDITQPNDDSVVSQALTTFRGSINNTSQIDIEIDGTYSNTVAIGSNQVTFATDINLTVGTHTIKITAYDICGGQNADDSIVITYTPKVDPSNGGTTETEVGGESGVVIGSDSQIEDNEVAQSIEQLPIIGAAVSIVADFATSIGLVATVPSSNVTAGVARVGLTVAALTSVVMAGTLAPLAAQTIPGLSEAFTITSHRSMLYLGWLIRGAGALTMAVVYFL